METVLGIDLGSTSVKIVILECITRKLIAEIVESHNADVLSESSKFNEQNVAKIFASVERSMKVLEVKYANYLSNVKCIAVSGQMHGVVLWSASSIKNDENLIAKFAQNEINSSHLITWQDQRADESFINSLPAPDSHLNVHSGYGCVSLLWLQRRSLETLRNCDRASTLADLFVVLLCHLVKPLMTVQNAANWGYCDVEKRSWNEEILKSIDFPLEFLPEIVETGHPAGRIKSSWHSIPANTLVLCAFGDFQCTVISKLIENSAVLNLSTSAQLTFRMPRGFIPAKIESNRASSVCYFPYFENYYLAVAASLNGGNVLSSFVRVLAEWTSKLTGISVPEAKIWSKILDNPSSSAIVEQNYLVKPTLFGERHAPSIGFSVENLFGSDDFTLETFSAKLIESIVLNLNAMLPKEILIENKINRLILTGQASKIHFKQFIEKLYADQMQIVSDDDSVADAALGCSFIACDYVKSNKI